MRGAMRVWRAAVVPRAGALRMLSSSSAAPAAATPLELIKQLRERTGAPIAECKKALESAGYSLDQAIKELKGRGAHVAAKLSSRSASEGVVSVSVSADSKVGTLVELRSETDFVARNTMFQDLAQKISDSVLDATIGGSSNLTAEAIGQLPVKDEETVSNAILNVVNSIREKIEVGSHAELSVDEGVVSAYVHNRLQPGVGQLAGMVALKSPYSDHAALQKLGRRLAMHIVASDPIYLKDSTIPADVIEKEKQQALEDAQGRDKAVQDKIVEGRMRKFYAEKCFLAQDFALEEMEAAETGFEDSSKKGKAAKKKVSDIVKDEARRLQTEIEVVGFARMKIGEQPRWQQL